jgi:hypothetical protein
MITVMVCIPQLASDPEVFSSHKASFDSHPDTFAHLGLIACSEYYQEIAGKTRSGQYAD